MIFAKIKIGAFSRFPPPIIRVSYMLTLVDIGLSEIGHSERHVPQNMTPVIHAIAL